MCGELTLLMLLGAMRTRAGTLGRGALDQDDEGDGTLRRTALSRGKESRKAGVRELRRSGPTCEREKPDGSGPAEKRAALGETGVRVAGMA